MNAYTRPCPRTDPHGGHSYRTQVEGANPGVTVIERCEGIRGIEVVPWRFQDATDLKSHVLQALGGASVCWTSMTGTGTFRDDRARQIGDELIAWINDNYTQKEN